jgi:hypothetical protein
MQFDLSETNSPRYFSWSFVLSEHAMLFTSFILFCMVVYCIHVLFFTVNVSWTDTTLSCSHVDSKPFSVSQGHGFNPSSHWFYSLPPNVKILPHIPSWPLSYSNSLFSNIIWSYNLNNLKLMTLRWRCYSSIIQSHILFQVCCCECHLCYVTHPSDNAQYARKSISTVPKFKKMRPQLSCYNLKTFNSTQYIRMYWYEILTWIQSWCAL